MRELLLDSVIQMGAGFIFACIALALLMVAFITWGHYLRPRDTVPGWESDPAEIPRKGAWQYIDRNPQANNETFFDKIEEFRNDFS